MTDCTSVIYAENNTELLWSIEREDFVKKTIQNNECDLIRSQLVSQLIRVQLVLFDWESNQQNL